MAKPTDLIDRPTDGKIDGGRGVDEDMMLHEEHTWRANHCHEKRVRIERPR